MELDEARLRADLRGLLPRVDDGGALERVIRRGQAARRRRTVETAAAVVLALAVVTVVVVGVLQVVRNLPLEPPVVTTVPAPPAPDTTSTTLIPKAEGSWQTLPLEVEGVGPVRLLVMDPSDVSVLYAATDVGLFKSTDGAENWTRLSLDGVSVVVVDPASPSTVYARAASLCRSDDGGATWQVLREGTRAWIATGIWLDTSTSPSTVYYWHGVGNLWKSADQGATWTVLLSDSLVSLVPDPAHPGTVYLSKGMYGSSPALERSLDGGATWEEFESQVTENGRFGVWCPRLAIDPGDPQRLYLDAEVTGTDRRVLMVSTDQARTWTPLSGTAAARARIVLSAPAGTPASTIDVLASFLPSYRGARPGAGDEGYASSEDWLPLSAGADDPSTLYAAAAAGVFKTTDAGVTWSAATRGLLFGQAGIGGVITDPTSSDVLYVTSDAGIFKSTDAGVSWRMILKGSQTQPGGTLVMAPSAPATLYAWTPGGLFRSQDGGGIWTERATRGLGHGVLGWVAADSPDTLFATEQGVVYRSADAGDSWEPCRDGMPSTASVGACLVFDPREPPTLYASFNDTSYAADICCGGIVRSSDGGFSWTVVVPDSDSALCSLAVDPDDSSVWGLWELPEGRVVRRSRDAGVTWQTLDLSLRSSLSWLRFDPGARGVMYAGGSSGLLLSEDGGVMWRDTGLETPSSPGIAGMAGSISGPALYVVAADGVLRKWVHGE